MSAEKRMIFKYNHRVRFFIIRVFCSVLTLTEIVQDPEADPHYKTDLHSQTRQPS